MTSYPIADCDGNVIAIHRRTDHEDGTKTIWLTCPDGTKGLPDGIGVKDLPLYGAELVKTIPITKAIFITEGEKAADALRAAGITALATVCGAAVTPELNRDLVRVAYGAKFVLWPDYDKPGMEHMKKLAQRLYEAGARRVEVIDYRPTDEDAEWPKGTDAADLVMGNRAVVELLVGAWSRLVAKRGHRTTKARGGMGNGADGKSHQATGLRITVGASARGSVTEALDKAFGIQARPGQSVKCPMHDDRQASLWVAKGDDWVICYGGSCSWGPPGVSAKDIVAVKP